MHNPLPIMAAIAVVAMLSTMSSGCRQSDAASSRQQEAAVEMSAVDSPTVENPDDGIHGFPYGLGCCYFDHEGAGYTLQEYFISGTAKTYTSMPTTAPYVTRILVSRPRDPARFNGTVMVEWENVTSQNPAEPGFVWAHHHMFREGYAYVAVSAQKAGVSFLALWDTDRYGALSHPGDDYSFDIFSQAVQAVRNPAGISPLGPLAVGRVIGYGQSQSARRLNDYINLAQNDANIIDGMIIQADDGSRKSFPTLTIPLIHLETEDSIVSTPPDPANPPELYRLWEVVGTSHVGGEDTQSPAALTLPLYVTIGTQISYEEDFNYWQYESNYGQEGPSFGLTCIGGSEMPTRYALDAALEGMNIWLQGGEAAPQPPRASFDAEGNLLRDEYGNALGGLRLPPIDVPVATYDATACDLLGMTISLSPETLHALYPTHEDYVSQMAAAIDAAVAQRTLLPADGDELLAKAQASAIPDWSVPPSLPPVLP